MTTSRTRRNKPQQARDLLLALLKDQEAIAARYKLAFEHAWDTAQRTQRTIELLDQAMLPGMEELAGETGAKSAKAEVIPPEQTITLAGVGTVTNRGNTPIYIQRIGEKTDINDVWPAPELGPTNHSKLMYSRVKDCGLCMAGVPFATSKRTDHYLVTKDTADMGRGYEYKPCTGVGKEKE